MLRSLADECASYLVLGLDGPQATAEEIKKAYRNLEAVRGIEHLRQQVWACLQAGLGTLALKEHPDKAFGIWATAICKLPTKSFESESEAMLC